MIDLAEGLGLWRAWSYMAWLDIRQKYRRTVMGPLWMPLTFLLTVLLMGQVWARIFKMEVTDYLPYVAAGLALWLLLASLLNECSMLLVHSKPLAQQTNLPLSFHVYRKVATIFLNFAHNVLALVVIMYLSGVHWKSNIVTLAPAFLMLAVFALWSSLTLSMLCLRYRDINHGLTVLTGIMPLLLPIYYRVEMLEGRRRLCDWNPLYHLIEVCRAPLLGLPTPAESWLFVAILNFLGMMLALAAFARFRGRLAYWM